MGQKTDKKQEEWRKSNRDTFTIIVWYYFTSGRSHQFLQHYNKVELRKFFVGTTPRLPGTFYNDHQLTIIFTGAISSYLAFFTTDHDHLEFAIRKFFIFIASQKFF